jgi:hypothetical protein
MCKSRAHNVGQDLRCGCLTFLDSRLGPQRNGLLDTLVFEILKIRRLKKKAIISSGACCQATRQHAEAR